MMNRFASRGFFALVATALAGLVVGLPTASPALGPQNVNLSCNDGTGVALALDLSALTSLTNAVTSTTLYPAGDPALACALAPSPNSPTTSNGNGPNPDFAVGGGQIFNQFVACQENFAVNGHAPDDVAVAGTANGTVNLSFPGTCATPGHLVTKVDCLDVNGDTADMTSTVTKSTGLFTAFFAVGDEAAWEVRDLDPLLPDEIVGQPTSGPCVFTATATPAAFSVVRGNITVHDN
jgi:hypothetical protein